MKYGNFLLGVLAGAAVYYLFFNKKTQKSVEVTVDTKNNEVKEYSNPIKKKYDIVLKPNKYTKEVVQKAKNLTKGRYEVDLNRVKEPVSI